MSGSSNESQESKRLIKAQAGKIEELKQKEAALARLLASVRMEKLDALRSRPLNIGIIGFGRFGQFIARTFAKHGRVVATSRSDYTDLASGMGITYIPLSNPQQFLEEDLDVIVLATSIVSFEDTVADLAPHLQDYIQKSGTGRGPLIVDVLSVKEHPRQILLDRLPKECDILCTHPMFGPDSGKNGWHGLNFVYEITRIDGVVLEQNDIKASSEQGESFVEEGGRVHSVHELSESHIEGKDRIERFLSIWEEEGCKMVPLSCKAHDAYAADSQFITHLMGRILGAQGLAPTPIDTKGFDSVLKLIDSTTADSFDLFYGLYKYNQNSMDTIIKLRDSMDDVVQKLKEMERNDK
jgi:prephenate dehydrogenase